MKTWENAEVSVLELEATAQGGKTFRNIDQVWYDEKNEAVADYES